MAPPRTTTEEVAKSSPPPLILRLASLLFIDQDGCFIFRQGHFILVIHMITNFAWVVSLGFIPSSRHRLVGNYMPVLVERPHFWYMISSIIAAVTICCSLTTSYHAKRHPKLSQLYMKHVNNFLRDNDHSR